MENSKYAAQLQVGCQRNNILGKDRLLRLSQIIGDNGLLPISRSTFYAQVRTGRYPAPVKLGARISAWRMSDIIDAIESASNEANDGGQS